MRRYYGIQILPEQKGSESLNGQRMPDKQTNPQPSPADSGLRRMLIWVFAALILTVVAAILVVEFTLRWFGER